MAGSLEEYPILENDSIYLLKYTCMLLPDTVTMVDTRYISPL